jgi:hypothetical protein
MSDLLGLVVGNIVNFIAILAHYINILFRNFILLAFVLAFFYGLFRLGLNGWRFLRGRGARQDPPGAAPQDPSANGGK